MSIEVSVFYHHYELDLLQVPIEYLIRKLPDYMHTRALRYKSKEAAINYIQGRLLLMYGLQFLGLKPTPADIKLSNRGKPSLPGTSFNISHTGRLALCAFAGDAAVGVDIEVPQLTKLDHLKHNFTAEEWQRIQADDQKPSIFYDLWCRKEAILKAADCTLIQLHQAKIDTRLNSIEYGEQSYHIQSLLLQDHPNVHGSICTSKPIAKIKYIPYSGF